MIAANAARKNHAVKMLILRRITTTVIFIIITIGMTIEGEGFRPKQ
jgi:hypothetical protein